MVEYSFDIGWGVHGFAPSPNQKIKSKSEWLSELISGLAEYNKMSESEVKEYMAYEFRKVK
ncbi:hypothetical protein [Vagococcus carniphilus]|uniref:hypothetical protein n=1 Tax=Vagococcus carniphilus TaxID=218144 RepID=UPI0028904220|nr:hypothetical protein [Vagococcus carniphilus]MDT2864663.1 hypothetical protein [Vagococcus carniphilus]